MADLDTLESLDGFAGLRNGLRRVAEKLDSWAGIPMPLEGQRLVVEPRFPKYAELMAIGEDPEERADQEELRRTVTVRNTFWSYHRRAVVVVWEESGRLLWAPVRTHGVDHQIATLGASDAWGIEQESNALQLLATLIGHRAFKQYLLTGMFLETSRRSGVTYLFRKLRPTVALTTRSGQTRVLCALCLHPIAYYRESWAGAMCPTDDVIAHLMLMRGDEPLYWRRANQHAPDRPEAGL